MSRDLPVIHKQAENSRVRYANRCRNEIYLAIKKMGFTEEEAKRYLVENQIVPASHLGLKISDVRLSKKQRATIEKKGYVCKEGEGRAEAVRRFRDFLPVSDLPDRVKGYQKIIVYIDADNMGNRSLIDEVALELCRCVPPVDLFFVGQRVHSYMTQLKKYSLSLNIKIYNVSSGKNGADMIIASIVGSRKNEEGVLHLLVSNDCDFDVLVEFYHNLDFSRIITHGTMRNLLLYRNIFKAGGSGASVR